MAQLMVKLERRDELQVIWINGETDGEIEMGKLMAVDFGLLLWRRSPRF